MLKKIAIFASGSGSNAENIITYFQNNPDFEFPLIISNKNDAFVHQRAKKFNISSFTFSKNDFDDGKCVVEFLKNHKIDVIVLAGFLLKISEPLLAEFPNKIINIHPALLPKYGGKGMYGHHVHEAVWAAGECQSGISIHYVNANYDEGDIIFQAKCDLTAADTPDSIAEKVHALEYEYFPKIIEKIFTEK
jgi:phosphoribosylglycinamide formyltransferase-1